MNFFGPSAFNESNDQRDRKQDSKHPSIAVQKIGEGQSIPLLAARHWHDKIHIAEFEKHQTDAAKEKEFFHGEDEDKESRITERQQRRNTQI